MADEDYKMTEAEVINYIKQVCEGLAHMHENNIVHLDIKVSRSRSLLVSRSPGRCFSLVIFCYCDKGGIRNNVTLIFRSLAYGVELIEVLPNNP